MTDHQEKSKRIQPAWAPPHGNFGSGLKLYNSLTRKKEDFVPQYGRQVRWYSCGPTVYDSSHMGHARSYISFDILRRVMKNYFNYDVFYAMNITDIDDKIIRRARQNHLVAEYARGPQSLTAVLEDVQAAMKPFVSKFEAEADKDKKAMYGRIIANVTKIIDDNMKVKDTGDTKVKETLVWDVQDILAEWLDAAHGAEVRDNAIFATLPRRFEDEYHTDMDALGVLRPDVLTRVSEYIPEVVTFVEKIIDNGYAYAANESVYFDTMKFSGTPNHFYAKLVPEAFGDKKALNEGEGDLSVSEDRLREKRSDNDFALWKASKPGEPAWDSPWGKGRPGWHIECSVMASSILGDSLDIHTGGVDLKFPHHDNELAQAEAHFGNDHWVRYFLHSGHLHIDGCKMSKSLKNFISIKDALRKHTACQLRLMFLLHAWKDTLDYSDNTMKEAIGVERMFNEFFLNVKAALWRVPTDGPDSFSKWGPAEMDLKAKYTDLTGAVHKALCDSIDTKGALDGLRDLVTASNVYLDSVSRAARAPDRYLLTDIATYITKMLKVFGVIDERGSVGFPQVGTKGDINLEETVMPYLLVFAEFRDSVRQVAREQKVESILSACDRVRDDALPQLGVRLEDKEGQLGTIKLVDKDTLLKEREEKLAEEEKKRKVKEAKKAEQAKAQAEKEAQNKIPPADLFKDPTKYTQWDDKGLPTHDAAGKELSKSQVKKLAKVYDAQDKKYQQYLKGAATSAQQEPTTGATDVPTPKPSVDSSLKAEYEQRFGDLGRSQGLQQLDTFLAQRSYLTGHVPSQADVVVSSLVADVPLTSYVHVARWYRHVTSFDPQTLPMSGTD